MSVIMINQIQQEEQILVVFSGKINWSPHKNHEWEDCLNSSFHEQNKKYGRIEPNGC